MNKQEIELDGAAVAYREGGRGIPVLLLHANVSDRRSWEPVEPLLAAHFRVINYSRRNAYPNVPIGDGIDVVLCKTRSAQETFTMLGAPTRFVRRMIILYTLRTSNKSYQANSPTHVSLPTAHTTQNRGLYYWHSPPIDVCS